MYKDVALTSRYVYIVNIVTRIRKHNYLAAILNLILAVKLDLFLSIYFIYMNHDIIINYFAPFYDYFMVYTAVTAISHKIMNNGGHLGFWRQS